PYLMHDLSYYNGRLYLYFGPTPALVLFWPSVALTGHHLLHKHAVWIFCTFGFLASVGLVYSLWRRYFPEVSVWVVAACALALGLATGALRLLARSDIYEVAISCGSLLTILALAAIWQALHKPRWTMHWLAAASFLYGLALGARPSLLFGAIILLLPLVQARHERRRIGVLLILATAPMLLIGSGLMFYNAMRFGSPFEFGLQFQLAVHRQVHWKFFDPHYLWFNFRMYFLEPARWSTRFPFVNDINAPTPPAGYGEIESPYGILPNIPLTW